jgi:hypothetical protein
VHHRLLRRPQPLSQEGRQRHRFMGSTCCGASTPQRAMIEDSTVEFLTMSSGEGSFGNFSSSRHSSGASLAPASTTTWKENAPAMISFPCGWLCCDQKPTSPSNGAMLIRKDSRRKLMLGIPPPRWGQRHDEASSPVGRPLSRFSHVCHPGTSLHSKWSGS